ncbi:MAG TPA: hypothetical protein VF498_02610 [Anaerolineales bacterium]
MRGRVFWPLLAATLALMVLLNWEGGPLVTSPAPYGIVSFELAGSVDRSQAILDSWDANAQLHAAFSLGVDYLFMVLYSAAIGLACIWSADRLHRLGWPLASLGAWLAWGLWLAALFDAVENVALLSNLFNGVIYPWPIIAYICALFKFGLILLGMVYTFFALAAHLASRLQPVPSA